MCALQVWGKPEASTSAVPIARPFWLRVLVDVIDLLAFVVLFMVIVLPVAVIVPAPWVLDLSMMVWALSYAGVATFNGVPGVPLGRRCATKLRTHT